MKKQTVSTILIHLVVWSVGLIWIVPFLGLFMTSIRPFNEVMHGWWNFDSFTLTFKNFIDAWNHPTASLSEGMRNSFVIAFSATILPIFMASIAAYGFARFSFPIKNYLFVTIVALMALPCQMIAVPIFFLMKRLDLLNTYLGLIIVHSAWGTPWILFFMRNFFITLPIEVEEAAKVDGATDFTIFFRIILPISLPALASAAVLQFMWVWNDFFLALILVYSPSKLLATQRIPLMRGVYFIDWGTLSAAAILVMLVPILVFAFLQRYYVRGMVGWTIK
ncbi:ABC transporter permease [Candidatus Atribacteria bacterium HGW-Atribacteria-1]|nr:MAG: ABC transporter permease [Candidatus Atribacteria bacterium HGW-Atribacteria-1]